MKKGLGFEVLRAPFPIVDIGGLLNALFSLVLSDLMFEEK